MAAFNIPGLPRSILGIIDEHTHARYRRPIQGAYSLTSLKGYESYVDDTINLLGGILDRYSESRKPVNLSLLAYYCEMLYQSEVNDLLTHLLRVL